MPRPTLYLVKGNSMQPALHPGDCLLTTPVRPDNPPARAAIIALAPHARGNERMLKRVIGLPGDHIAFEDGMLYINGERYTEPYLRGLPSNPGLQSSTTTLAPDEYFVMGDNRPHSTDSRHYGPITLPEIEGIARWRIWPPRRWGNLH